MKKQVTHVILLLITFSFLNANASSDFDKAMLKAKKNLKTAMNKSDETQLLKVRGEFERILQLKEKVWLVNYYIALSDYGLATAAMVKENTDNLKKYTQSGIDVINKSIDEYPEFADSFVLLQALHFNRWQYEQEKMQEIIAATTSADESAVKLEKNNPRLLMLNGMASYYTPEAFGGGAAVALPKLEKAVDVFKTRKETSELYPDWGYDLAMGYLAMALLKRNDDGDMKKAKEIIDEAIVINPDSGFITAYVMGEYKKSTGSK
ncbi:MAG: hypothetical protein IPL53_01685 [Ignavibacteria bacterium]|nr:hypothetical protein [Ignavibacteria bacterium]